MNIMALSAAALSGALIGAGILAGVQFLWGVFL